MKIFDKPIPVLLTLLAITLAFIGLPYGLASASQLYERCLIPRPQELTYKGFNIDLTNNCVIVTESGQDRYYFSASWLKQHLKDSLSLDLPIKDFKAAAPGNRIVMGNPGQHPFISRLLDARGLKLPSTLGPEGYLLHVFGSPRREIIVAANAPNGVFYGIQTLIQLFDGRKVRGAHILDYPDHRIRAVDVHFFRQSQLRGKPPRFTRQHMKIIDKLAAMKINAIAMYTGSDFCKKSPLYHNPYVQMAQYCRDRFIDFIPGIGTLRSIAWVPFDLAEGWWVKDEPFKFNSDDWAIAEKPPVNLIHDGDFETSSGKVKNLAGWRHYGQLEVDPRQGFKSRKSLKIIEGNLVQDIPVESNSYYHLSAYCKGGIPVIGMAALGQSGKKLYGQSDSTKKMCQGWRKFGVVLKTTSEVQKLRVVLSTKRGPVWIDKVNMVRLNGALQNVIRCPTTDFKVASLDKAVVYREGVDYKVINGQRSKRYDESLHPFRIRRLKKGSIIPNQKVLVSYDCLLYWARSHWYNQPPCVSDERLYRDYYYPAIDRVIYSLHPKMINLASDEIRGFNRDSRNKKKRLTNARLFAEWLNKLNRYVKSRDHNCRVMIWDDMVSPYHNGGKKDYQLKYGGSPGKMADTVEQDMINKSVVINVWWYTDRYYPQMVEATKFFESKGFDYLGACWFKLSNIRTWGKLLLNRPHALGGFATNWGRNNFSAFADYFWNTNSANKSYSLRNCSW